MATQEERDFITEKYKQADQNARTQQYANMFGGENSGYGLIGLMEEVAASGAESQKAGLTAVEYQAGLHGTSVYNLLSDLYDNVHGYGFDGIANTEKGTFIMNGLSAVAQAHGSTIGEYFNAGSETGWGGPGTLEYENAVAGMGSLYGSKSDVHYNQIGGAVTCSVADTTVGQNASWGNFDTALAGGGAGISSSAATQLANMAASQDLDTTEKDTQQTVVDTQQGIDKSERLFEFL